MATPTRIRIAVAATAALFPWGVPGAAAGAHGAPAQRSEAQRSGAAGCGPASSAAAGQWRRLPALPGAEPADAVLLSPCEGVVVGSSTVAGDAVAFHTADGGMHFTPTRVPSSLRELRSVAAAGSLVIATGATKTGRSAVVRSTDGGRTWSAVTLPGSAADPLRAVALHGSRGWAAGGRTILATSDGGRTWRAGPRAPGATFLAGLDFGTARHGWVSGSAGTRIYVAETRDGGAHWIPEQLPAGGGAVFQVQFVGGRTGWAVGGTAQGAQHATILRTTTGGQVWHVLHAPGRPLVALGVLFTSSRRGFVALQDGLQGEILATTDGGSSWSVQAKGAGLAPGPFTRSGSTVWMAGSRGLYSFVQPA
jgi:photosystem II stability/assembly factor-like uncharacterized protein